MIYIILALYILGFYTHYHFAISMMELDEAMSTLDGQRIFPTDKYSADSMAVLTSIVWPFAALYYLMMHATYGRRRNQ